MMECDAAHFAGLSLPEFDALEIPEQAETIAYMVAKDMIEGYYQDQAERRRSHKDQQ